MKHKNWHGVMKLIEFCHYDANGNLKLTQSNLLNTLHQEGELFLLNAAFTGGQNSNIIPAFYYLGLDARATVSAADTMISLIGEPTGNGYQRQQIPSNGVFAVNLEQGHYIATSPIVAFRAASGNWGPVTNLFLTDKFDNSGSLISTVVLTSPVSVNAGNAVTMRIGMQIINC